MVNAVLATDMTCHFALIEKFAQIVEQNAKKAKDAKAAPGSVPFSDVERSVHPHTPHISLRLLSMYLFARFLTLFFCSVMV